MLYEVITNKELIEELKSEKAKAKSEQDEELETQLLNDMEINLEKIYQHGKRADAIVKGMLQHSGVSSGQKEPTDINALCDEYLRLSYHGVITSYSIHYTKLYEPSPLLPWSSGKRQNIQRTDKN